MWEFRCVDPEGRDMCFNGGVCSSTLIGNISTTINEEPGEFCICPAGSSFTYDYDWFHFPNCVRDVNSSKHFFIQYAIFAILLSAALLKLIIFKFRSDVRVIASLALGFPIFLIGMTLSIYLQGGCFEGCSIFANISFLIIDICLGKLIVVVMRPLYLLQNKSFKHFRAAIWSSTIVFAIGTICTGIAMLVTCREPNPRRFNGAAFASTALLWIGGVVQVSCTLIACHRLEEKIRRAMNQVDSSGAFSQRSKDLLARLRVLQRLISIVIGPFTALTVGVPVVLTYLQSFPYFFVVEYMEVEFSIVFCFALLIFLRQSSSTTKETPSSLANGSRVQRESKGSKQLQSTFSAQDNQVRVFAE